MCYCYYLVGNKNDATPDKKVVKTEDAQKFAEQIGVPLYETSAKENQNVEEVRVYMCVDMYILVPPTLQQCVLSSYTDVCVCVCRYFTRLRGRYSRQRKRRKKTQEVSETL